MTHPANEKRASNAEDALNLHARRTGEKNLSDLLSDLMHWGDCYGEDFEQALTSARMNYAAEVNPDDLEQASRALAEREGVNCAHCGEAANPVGGGSLSEGWQCSECLLFNPPPAAEEER